MEQEPLPTFCVLGNILQISHELLANICITYILVKLLRIIIMAIFV